MNSPMIVQFSNLGQTLYVRKDAVVAVRKRTISYPLTVVGSTINVAGVEYEVREKPEQVFKIVGWQV